MAKTNSNNEVTIYHILCRREKVPDLRYDEYLAAARKVVASIPPEAVTPLEELLSRLEERILKRRNE